ncbi:hypothetical protein ACFX13_045072 [Malus domestica]
MASSRTFLHLGLAFDVLLLSSEISARELAETTAQTQDSVEKACDCDQVQGHEHGHDHSHGGHEHGFSRSSSASTQLIRDGLIQTTFEEVTRRRGNYGNTAQKKKKEKYRGKREAAATANWERRRSRESARSATSQKCPPSSPRPTPASRQPSAAVGF